MTVVTQCVQRSGKIVPLDDHQLTAQMLKVYLHYNPETGVFTRIQTYCNRVKAGSVAGSTARSKNGVSIKLFGKSYRAHRLAWLYMTGAWPDRDIDHKNGDPMDNRFSNLRDVSRSINAGNSRRHRRRKHALPMGVTRNSNKSKCYSAAISVNGHKTHIGVFESSMDAHKAYMEAKRELHRLPREFFS